MYVVPDVFPSLDPKIDLEIKFDSVVEPGTYQLPKVVSIDIGKRDGLV